MTEVPLEEVKFVRDIYPRFEADNATVNQYRQAIDNLPPILVTRDLTIIDGYHRLLAHRLEGREEIEVEYFESDDEKDVLIECIRRNCTHGRQLTMDEKRENAKRLYREGFTQQEISDALSVSMGYVSNWVSPILEKRNNQRDAEILDLYLRCHSYREIADRLEINHQTVGNSLSKFFKNEEIRHPDNLQVYNTWSIGGLPQSQLKYPGQTPLDIVENLVYYYTEPPRTEPRLHLDKVVDPMAGSGIVRDACRKLFRRYRLYDLEPLREDIPIEQHDILSGVPDDAGKADLVYFDPPYFDLMSEYPDNSFNSDYDMFLDSVAVCFNHFREMLCDNGKVAMILKPMNREIFGGEWYDLTFDSVQIAQDKGFKLIKRIAAPLSTQQFQSHHVTRANEKKTMLNTLRDIVILEKEKKKEKKETEKGGQD